MTTMTACQTCTYTYSVNAARLPVLCVYKKKRKKKVISGIVIFILKIGQFYFDVHEHIRALSYWHILKA